MSGPASDLRGLPGLATPSALAVALVGVGLGLPKCHALAGSSQAGSVMGYAVDARSEIAEQLRKLHASAGG